MNFTLQKRFFLVVFSFSVVGLFSCNSGEKGEGAETHENHGVPATELVKEAKAILSATYPDTALNGSANFTLLADGKVKLELEITVPSKAGKSVAVHFHEHGDCGEHGMASHGHWNPTNQNHGKWGSEAFHLGDIGNISLDSDGKGSIIIETDLWAIGGEGANNIVGRAVIVHAGEDDYTTQPTGNSGGRIGCGVIQ